MKPTNEAVSPEVARSAVPVEYLDLADAVVVAHNEAHGTPAEWTNATFRLRVAAVMKIAADRMRDEVLRDYAAICGRPECTEYRKNDDIYCSDECDEAHEIAVRSDAALDARTTAHMDARQMGEVA